MALVAYPDKETGGKYIYHLLCNFCGDENVEPANGQGYANPLETVVFCNCCGKNGKPKFLDYSMSRNKELN